MAGGGGWRGVMARSAGAAAAAAVTAALERWPTCFYRTYGRPPLQLFVLTSDYSRADKAV